VLLILAAGVIGSGMVTLPQIFGKPSAPQEPRSAVFLQKVYGAELLLFVHPTLGFKIRYPAGYILSYTTNQTLVLKIAAFSQEDVPASINFYVTGERATREDIDGLAGNMPYGEGSTRFELVSKGKKTFGNKTFYSMQSVQESSLLPERLFVTHVLVECPRYSGIMVHAVPESLLSEQRVFDAAMDSFEC
jgi:hypothetical protein